MPFPDEVPGRVYTEPMDFHEGEVERIDAGYGGDYNHGDALPGTNGPVRFWESYDGNGFYSESVSTPYPGGAATSCCWLHASKGHTVSGIWGGTCPLVSTTSPSGDTGAYRGSMWETHTSPDTPFFNDTSSCSTAISGWLVRPWRIYAGYTNQWMNDDDLMAEVAAITAPSGWFLEWEAYHPIFVGYQIAPDETLTGTIGLRTEGVTWLYDPAGWNFYGVDSGGQGIWDTGVGPSGTELVHYAGGLADWMDPPASWPVPMQDPDRFTCAFIEPEGGDTEGVPLTVACDSLYPTGPVPDDNGTAGREDVSLLVRAVWRTPQYRFYREMTTVPPRRIFGRSDGTTHGAKRVRGGGNTVQSGNRTRGSIL